MGVEAGKDHGSTAGAEESLHDYRGTGNNMCGNLGGVGLHNFSGCCIEMFSYTH